MQAVTVSALEVSKNGQCHIVEKFTLFSLSCSSKNSAMVTNTWHCDSHNAGSLVNVWGSHRQHEHGQHLCFLNPEKSLKFIVTLHVLDLQGNSQGLTKSLRSLWHSWPLLPQLPCCSWWWHEGVLQLEGDHVVKGLFLPLFTTQSL